MPKTVSETRGYLLVATLSYAYYEGLRSCVESLKDEVPHAKVAVFAHEEWITDSDRELFDYVFAPAPVHCRAKLWALDKSPFDVTAYLDADSLVISPEIEEVFDHMEAAGPEVDLMMTENRPYNSKVVYFQDADQNNGEARELFHYDPDHIKLYREGKAHKFRWHCGMLVYRKNDKTQKLWSEWVRYYRLHNETENHIGIAPYPVSLAYWDTFAFWRLIHEQNGELGVNIKRLPNDAKYNFVTGYKETEIKSGHSKAVLHYTIPPAYVKETTINEASLNTTYGNFDTFK
tara:strand:+ start:2046 stop:2912 length:867 start_codon:yes stop_codon:yes gene_type:complete